MRRRRSLIAQLLLLAVVVVVVVVVSLCAHVHANIADQLWNKYRVKMIQVLQGRFKSYARGVQSFGGNTDIAQTTLHIVTEPMGAMWAKDAKELTSFAGYVPAWSTEWEVTYTSDGTLAERYKQLLFSHRDKTVGAQAFAKFNKAPKTMVESPHHETLARFTDRTKGASAAAFHIVVEEATGSVSIGSPWGTKTAAFSKMESIVRSLSEAEDNKALVWEELHYGDHHHDNSEELNEYEPEEDPFQMMMGYTEEDDDEPEEESDWYSAMRHRRYRAGKLDDELLQLLEEEEVLSLAHSASSFRRIGRRLRRIGRRISRGARRVVRSVGRAARRVGRAVGRVVRQIGRPFRSRSSSRYVMTPIHIQSKKFHLDMKAQGLAGIPVGAPFVDRQFIRSNRAKFSGKWFGNGGKFALMPSIVWVAMRPQVVLRLSESEFKTVQSYWNNKKTLGLAVGGALFRTKNFKQAALEDSALLSDMFPQEVLHNMRMNNDLEDEATFTIKAVDASRDEEIVLQEGRLEDFNIEQLHFAPDSATFKVSTDQDDSEELEDLLEMQDDEAESSSLSDSQLFGRRRRRRRRSPPPPPPPQIKEKVYEAKFSSNSAYPQILAVTSDII